MRQIASCFFLKTKQIFQAFFLSNETVVDLFLEKVVSLFLIFCDDILNLLYLSRLGFNSSDHIGIDKALYAIEYPKKQNGVSYHKQL